MKAVIQRVLRAEVVVDGKSVSSIDRGILTLLGIAQGDDENKVRKAIQKIMQLRIFEDPQGKMNLSLAEVKGSHLIVSQFTLLGDCSTGRRPSFINAASPEIAKPLYEEALRFSREIGNDSGIKTEGGVFQADMKVSLINDGPVTFVFDL